MYNFLTSRTLYKCFPGPPGPKKSKIKKIIDFRATSVETATFDTGPTEASDSDFSQTQTQTQLNLARKHIFSTPVRAVVA